MRVSKNLTLQELIYSEKAIELGIINNPTPHQLSNLKLIAQKVFEPAREHFNVPIKVSSGFRISNLNQALKGSTTSQHCGGQALDLQIKKGYTNADLFYFIKDKLDFDQLIWEFGTDKEPDWVHVSYTATNNRKEVLKGFKVNGAVHYKPFKDK
jgi:hypothetical protein